MTRRGGAKASGEQTSLLDLFMDQLADRVAARLYERGLAGAASQFVDQTSAPVSRRIYLRAALAGAFPSSKIDGKVVAKRADVERWIESRRRPVKGAAPAHAELDDLDAEVERITSGLGYRRVG